MSERLPVACSPSLAAPPATFVRPIGRIQSTSTPSLSHFRPAFTLIELICVIIILGVMAAVIVPRTLNTRSRTAELEAQAVQRLLTIAAEKSALWSLPVAVDYSDSRLTLWSLRADKSASTDAVGTATAKWTTDPLTEPVPLSQLRIKQAAADNQVLSGSKWRVVFAPGLPRPVLSIELATATGTGPGWQITLDADASAASRASTSPDSTPPRTVARTIDLDDTGKGTAAW